MTFFHCHCHSEYSVLDAILRLDEACNKAVSLNQPALGLTDHGTMAGLVQHYQTCRKHNLIPLMGVEAYVVPSASAHAESAKERAAEVNSEARKAGERKQVTTTAGEAAKHRRHCLLWAKDFEGYQVLTRAMSKAYAQMFYKPLLDHQDVAEIGRSGKVMMTTGCVSAEIPRLLQNGQYEAAEQRLLYYREVFGANFLIELQNHGLKDINEVQLNEQLTSWAEEFSIPLICTSDVHYVEPEDADVHSFYKRMAYKGKMNAGYSGEGYWLTDVEYMKDQFTAEQWRMSESGLDYVLDACRGITFPPLDTYSYAVPEIVKTDPLMVLMAITKPGLEALYDGKNNLEYLERWQTELKVIRDTEFAQYFLFVRLIVQYCEDHHIFFLARGSASGSLLCYLLGITQLDPIKHNLLFERFLSNDRSKPPDIDLDVEDQRRDEVLRYISQRFETTQVGTVLTFQPKSAKNEVLAQYRLDLDAKGITTVNTSDDDLLGTEWVQRLLQRIGGVAKVLGGHPAGVIAETPGRSVRDLVPLSFISSSARWITQYDMDDIEALGFTKVDILGVRSLRVIRRCIEMLGKKDWNWIPDDDRATFVLLQKGFTEGVFTFKGWSNKKGCQQLKPKDLDDCSLVAAMWRPSCLELGLEQQFLERRKGKWKPPADWHPAIRDNLAETYGIAVYQEQVILVMRALGFTPDDIMVMLRGVKKKDAKLMAKIKVELYRITEPKTADHVWELMEGYTHYGFNKSHSYAYALVGYRMAYLKANHPLEFMCATLECETDKTSQQLYMREAKKLGLQVLPVDVMSSSSSWTIERTSLRRGLTSVTGVGFKASRALIQARPFADVKELREKANSMQCNVGILKKLADAGAFRSMGIVDEVELTVEMNS